VVAVAVAMRSSDCRFLLQKGREDPVWWVKTVLGVDLWHLQREILESVRDNEETCVASCHGMGKTFVASCVALWFLYCHRPALVLTTAPTDRQVRSILWKEIHSRLRDAPNELGGRLLQQELHLERDWMAVGFTAPDYDVNRFQGFHEKHILVVVDEACGVTAQIMDGIDGVLSSEHSRKLSIGNPVDPLSPFAKDFTRSGVSQYHISVYDTPNFSRYGITERDLIDGSWESKIVNTDPQLPQPKLVTPHWAARMIEKWGPESPLWKARGRGEFPVASADTLIPLSWIHAAQQRTLEPGATTKLAVDVARSGSDETVIAERRGPVARVLESYIKRDTMETVGHVARWYQDRDAYCVAVDAVGLGAGVCDRLDEMEGYDVQEVQAGASPNDKSRFVNVRAEMFWNLRTLFEHGDIDIDPDDDELMGQIAEMRYKIRSNGKIQVESKEDMAKRGVSSPDRADALAMLYYDEEPPQEVFLI
jgi:phage terminase large subunit